MLRAIRTIIGGISVTIPIAIGLLDWLGRLDTIKAHFPIQHSFVFSGKALTVLECFGIVMLGLVLVEAYRSKRKADPNAQGMRARPAESLSPVQRPKLTVRNVVVTQLPFARGKEVHGQFLAANTGEAGAGVLESHCIVVALEGPSLPMECPYEGQNGNNPIPRGTVISRGDSATGLIFDGNPFPDKDPNPTPIAGTSGVHTNVYVMGWIEYSNADGSVKYPRAAFCRKYAWELQRFVPVDNPDYEH